MQGGVVPRGSGPPVPGQSQHTGEASADPGSVGSTAFITVTA